jgi:hypothetical protein
VSFPWAMLANRMARSAQVRVVMICRTIPATAMTSKTMAQTSRTRSAMRIGFSKNLASAMPVTPKINVSTISAAPPMAVAAMIEYLRPRLRAGPSGSWFSHQVLHVTGHRPSRIGGTRQRPGSRDGWPVLTHLMAHDKAVDHHFAGFEQSVY